MSSNQQYSSYNGIIRPILKAGAAILVLFLLFILIENIWLQNIDNETLHLFHLIRGLFISFVAAVFVGWLLLKSPLPFSESSHSPEKTVLQNRPDKKERMAGYALWFIRMRWIAILVASILSWFVVKVAEWLPHEVWWPVVSAILVLTFLNLGYTYFLRKGKFVQYLLPFQAYADLIILMVLLHFSGGIENPLSLLILFHVIIAGIILTRRHCYTVAASASILLALIAVAEITGLINHYTLTLFPHATNEAELAHASLRPFYVAGYVGLLSTIFFLTAYFVTTLADRLRQGEQQLERYAEQAHEHRQLIEKALETTNTGLCVCSKEGEPYWINERWESWFGSQTIDNFAHKNQLKQPVDACKILQDEKTHVSEITVPSTSFQKDSKIYQITTAPLKGKEGKMGHVISLAQDITEQKKAQEQMMRAGKLAAVGELAGHVAHEVNNPIGIISAKARLLIGDHPDDMSPKVRQELKKIINAADRVAQIAQGLLSYCRPSVATRTEIDISVPIHEALSLVEQRARKSDVNIKNQLSANLPSVEANADEMQQVFLNLFLNALDAMPEGGTLSISVEPEREEERTAKGYLAIVVQDTGSGIRPEIQEHVFEPFFTTKEEGKGTGLGLSICSGLIRSHEGSIDVESEPGKGTMVTVRLPIKDKQKEDV